MNPKLKAKKASNKVQGEKAVPKQGNTGMGLEFAQSLGNILEGAKAQRGSNRNFLGKEKMSIDAKEYAHSLKENKKPK